MELPTFALSNGVYIKPVSNPGIHSFDKPVLYEQVESVEADSYTVYASNASFQNSRIYDRLWSIMSRYQNFGIVYFTSTELYLMYYSADQDKYIKMNFFYSAVPEFNKQDFTYMFILPNETYDSMSTEIDESYPKFTSDLIDLQSQSVEVIDDLLNSVYNEMNTMQQVLNRVIQISFDKGLTLSDLANLGKLADTVEILKSTRICLEHVL